MNTKRRPARPRRSATSKAKKPKFLSLRLQFPVDENKNTAEIRSCSAAVAAASDQSPQLNLFSLEPENNVEDRESHDHENVAYFFSSADGGDTSTLNSLLESSAATVSQSSIATANYSSRPDDLSPSSASLTYAYGVEDGGESRAAFVRNALRNRERDSGEEKWVCYSEVVERKVIIKEEEVTSSVVAADDRATGIRRLSLKLDYEEILSAWSDKGPLYIDGESSQIVPDINDELLTHEVEASIYGVGRGSCNVGLWTVPEMVGDMNNGGGDDDHLKVMAKMGQREASVLRYKEKRQCRLFSKKIRYQVRKLNADKRPRLKGRFVKRS